MDKTVVARNCFEHNDPDWVALHAFFTCMCIHVEEERGGEQGLVEHIAFVRKAETKAYSKFRDLHVQYPTSEDWERTKDDEFFAECSQRIKEAADCMWCWWL